MYYYPSTLAYTHALLRFISGLFVYKLYLHLRASKQADLDTGHTNSGCRSLILSYPYAHLPCLLVHTIDSWSERFRILFYIFVSNFILPIIMNIAEIIVIFCDTNFLRGFIVVTVNCYVTILGVLLATIWAQGSAKGKPPGWAGFQEGRRTTRVTTLQFASRQVPNAETQTSQDGNDSVEFIENEPMSSAREKGAVVHSAQASDSAMQTSLQEENQEKKKKRKLNWRKRNEPRKSYSQLRR